MLLDRGSISGSGQLRGQIGIFLFIARVSLGKSLNNIEISIIFIYENSVIYDSLWETFLVSPSKYDKLFTTRIPLRLFPLKISNLFV